MTRLRLDHPLCWHTNNGGWRCGATTGLNNNALWERKIFRAI